MQSCRNALLKLNLNSGANASLLLSRYVPEIKIKDKNTESNEDAIKMQHEVYEAMRKAIGTVGEVYKSAFNRRREQMKDAKELVLETLTPLVIGLGEDNVFETGLTLNRIYGTPIIPGSAIKGVAAYYCSSVLGKNDSNFLGPCLDERNRPTQKAGAIYELLFGKIEQTYDPAKKRAVANEKPQAGWLRVYDAWIEPESVKGSALKEDVMTPHHGEYYSGKADSPTDFDSPNPVSFLTVCGKFRVAVDLAGPAPEFLSEEEKQKREQVLDLAVKIIEEALREHGIGAKVNAGYGRLERYLSSEEKAEIKRREEEEKKRQEEEKKRNERKEAGFNYAKGDQADARCVDLKNDKKFGPKPKFEIDGIKVIFTDGVPKNINKGDTVKVVIDIVETAPEKLYRVKKV